MSHSTRELLASLTLALLGHPPLRDRVALVREKGPLSALETMGPAPATIRRRAENWRRVSLERGFRLLTLFDDDYPRLLKMTPDPPLVLSVWGELSLEDAFAVAVVGSRRATAYGLEMARRLGAELAEQGLVIVSGLARGIDAAAHRGALAASGRTLAVLGSGLLELYPREHGNLAKKVAASGAVLSEFPPDEPPRARNFPRRNRIITGLSMGTLVVEAALKSGSLVSARHALEQDRDVFAVPGPARSENSEGCHALIRDGARLVTRAEHVLEELRPEVRELLRTRTPGGAATRVGPELTGEDEQRVYEALSADPRPRDFDGLMQELELPADRTVAALSALELKGIVWVLPGGLYQLRP